MGFEPGRTREYAGYRGWVAPIATELEALRAEALRVGADGALADPASGREAVGDGGGELVEGQPV